MATSNDDTRDHRTSPRPMRRQVRVALVVFIVALAVGWLGLRQSNAALADALASAPGGTP